MIVSIAGTSGAGKTTLARALIAQATEREDVKSDGRVVGAMLELPGKQTTLLVGKYEDDLQTCGCDTIKDVVRVYQLVHDYAVMGCNVVYEGLFVMNHTRGPALVREHPGNVTVICLTTPLAVCKESVNQRRAVQGNGPLEDWKNTEGNAKRAAHYGDKMMMAGARRIYSSREKALEHILAALA